MPSIPRRRRPEADWTCREVLDAQAIDPLENARCEFCGTRIRWVHVLEHDDYDRAVEAGCCCAARLCFDYDAEAAERELKNRMGRLARFVDARRWKRSRNYPVNICRQVRTPDGGVLWVTVFLREGRYGVYLAGRHPDDRYCHPEKYASQSEAMSVAFDLVEHLKDKG